MRRKVFVGVLSAILLASTPIAAIAADPVTPAPSAKSSPDARAPKPVLTQVQNAAVAAARLVFNAAQMEAKNGFSRAIADAQAIRDQAIAVAGNDKSAIKLARTDYRDFYRTILGAYRADLKVAKLNFLNALAAAKVSSKTI